MPTSEFSVHHDDDDDDGVSIGDSLALFYLILITGKKKHFNLTYSRSILGVFYSLHWNIYCIQLSHQIFL